ncbi:MAG: hypothetical protein Q7V05_11415 [Methanoregula sp.]|nr:hypothetical protein [Methanoregula sp.]
MTHISISKKLTDRYHSLGGNVSGFCRRCVEQEITRIENEIGGTRRQAMQPPTTNPKEGDQIVST